MHSPHFPVKPVVAALAQCGQIVRGNVRRIWVLQVGNGQDNHNMTPTGFILLIQQIGGFTSDSVAGGILASLEFPDLITVSDRIISYSAMLATRANAWIIRSSPRAA